MEVFGPEERKEVMDVLETGALFRYGHEHIRKGMWKTREFEDEVRKFTGAGYAHAVSSGSTAVATMMAAAGVGHGDEVVEPPSGFEVLGRSTDGKIASIGSACWRNNSMPIVPCPAITSGSSNGWIKVSPFSWESVIA